MVSRNKSRRGFGQDVEQIAWWLLFAALAVFGVVTWNWRLLLLTLLLWSFYEICLIRTRCRVKTRQGNECIQRVRGRAFAHDAHHQGIKNDGLWQLIGRPNPFYKPKVSDPNRATGVVLVAPKVRHRLDQQDQYILYAAFAGLAVSLIGMVWGLFL